MLVVVFLAALGLAEVAEAAPVRKLRRPVLKKGHKVRPKSQSSKWAHLNAAQKLMTQARVALKQKKFATYNRYVAQARRHLAAATVKVRPRRAVAKVGTRARTTKRRVWRHHGKVARLAKERIAMNDKLLAHFPFVKQSPSYRKVLGHQQMARRFQAQRVHYKALDQAKSAYKVILAIAKGKKESMPKVYLLKSEELEAPATAEEAGVSAAQEAAPEQAVVEVQTEVASDPGEADDEGEADDPDLGSEGDEATDDE